MSTTGGLLEPSWLMVPTGLQLDDFERSGSPSAGGATEQNVNAEPWLPHSPAAALGTDMPATARE